MDDVAPERKRKAIVFTSPPNTQVMAEFEAFVPVSQLAFMNNQADICHAGANGLEDLIERDDDKVEVLRRFAQPELQGEKCAGHGAWNGNSAGSNLFSRKLGFGDEHRPVTVAHAGAAGQEGILVAHVSVGMDTHSRNIEFAAGGAFVEGLNVLQDMLEFEAEGCNQFLCQVLKHESSIRVQGVAKGQRLLRHARKLRALRQDVTSKCEFRS